MLSGGRSFQRIAGPSREGRVASLLVRWFDEALVFLDYQATAALERAAGLCRMPSSVAVGNESTCGPQVPPGRERHSRFSLF